MWLLVSTLSSNIMYWQYIGENVSLAIRVYIVYITQLFCLLIYLWSPFASIHASMYLSMHPSIHPLVIEKMRRQTSHKLYPLPLTSSFLFSVTSEMWHLMTLPPTLWRLCGAVAVMWALALWLMLEIEQGSCKRDSSSSWGASQVECDKSPFTIGAWGQG